jgi:hypothetical protein
VGFGYSKTDHAAPRKFKQPAKQVDSEPVLVAQALLPVCFCSFYIRCATNSRIKSRDFVTVITGDYASKPSSPRRSLCTFSVNGAARQRRATRPVVISCR